MSDNYNFQYPSTTKPNVFSSVLLIHRACSLQNGIVFLPDVTYELQSVSAGLCRYRCDDDGENAFVLKRAPTINHTWTDGFGEFIGTTCRGVYKRPLWANCIFKNAIKYLPNGVLKYVYNIFVRNRKKIYNLYTYGGKCAHFIHLL